MIRFCHTSDLHLGIKKYGRLNSKTALNTRLEEDLVQFDKVINFAIQKKCNFFFLTGDIFNNRKPLSIVRKEFTKRLKRLQDNKIKTIILIGNHEYENSKDETHCLSSEKILVGSYIKIVGKQLIIKEEKEKVYIYCLPYCARNKNIKLENFMKNVIVLGHFTIDGVKKDDYTFAGKEYINVKVFSDKKIIYVGMGHIHNHQSMLDKKVVYSGSLNRINFNDESSNKGFIFGEIKNKNCNWKFIKLKSRKFLTIKLDWKKGVKKIWDEMDLKGKIIKVNISETKEGQIIPIRKIKSYLVRREAILDKITIKRIVEKKIRDENFRKNSNPEELLKKYLKKESFDVIKLGVTFLKEVKYETL